jgi:hypothetical protein
LIVTDSNLQAFRAAIEEAASSAAATLECPGSSAWDLRVPRAALCCLSDFPEQAVFCSEETVASVLVSHHGDICGTSVIAFEPRHALALIRSLARQGHPTDLFRKTGASLLQGLLGGFAAARARRIEFGRPTLEESSMVATILGTHAPHDTMLVSLELGFVSPEQAFPSYLYWLLDAKALESTLGLVDEGRRRREPALA